MRLAMETKLAWGTVRGVDVGEGPEVLVLLHAFPLDAGAYEEDALALAREGLRVIAPSCRGFGGTTPWGETPPSIDAMADDVAALLDALGIGPPVTVAGISMGGYVALALARRHAPRLAGLVLADTKAEADGPEARAGRDEATLRVRGGDLAGYLDTLLPKLLGKTTRAARPEVVARAREIAARADGAAVACGLRALRDRPDARDVLARVTVPTAVLVGDEDVVTPPDVVRALADGIPGATFEVVPQAGHLPNLESPTAFREAVLRLTSRARGQ